MTRTARALLSVSDKAGLESFAKSLIDKGFELVSTGGTAAALRRAGLEVRDVSDVTGFPEIMDGRVKTLHPKIHGGLLGRPDTDGDVMRELDIAAIEIVVVNLYPFESTIARSGVSFDEAIENIDIGGPAMIRAAAKNHAHVTVVVDPADYAMVAKKIASGDIDHETRKRLARKAFGHTSKYDAAIWQYLGDETETTLPEEYPLGLRKQSDLRYGENPHQRAALYATGTPRVGTLLSAQMHQGKELSYNNIADTDAALECVKAMPENACVIVKHANPCGVGIGSDLLMAYEKAFATDPSSAFGGIIAFNAPVGESLAQTIVERQFLEVIVAPDFDSGALRALNAKKNVRVLATGPLSPTPPGLRVQALEGGMLVQDKDTAVLEDANLSVVTERQPTPEERADALLAWCIGRFVKSNAIVYCRDSATLGIGAGQMSRVTSARIAAWKAADAKLDTRGAAMASDAFFPFRDGIDLAAEHGISAVIQPGGSIRDDEVIAAANEHDMAMLFTGMRHFRH